jgi:hypothetical protein
MMILTTSKKDIFNNFDIRKKVNSRFLSVSAAPFTIFGYYHPQIFAHVNKKQTFKFSPNYINRGFSCDTSLGCDCFIHKMDGKNNRALP